MDEVFCHTCGRWHCVENIIVMPRKRPSCLGCFAKIQKRLGKEVEDMTPEAKVKKEIRDWMKGEGIFSFMPVSNGMGMHGVSDVIACVPVTITPDMVGLEVGVFFAVETKAPGKRGHKNRGASVLQVRFMKNVAKAFGFAMVADCVEEVKEIISKIRGGISE